jgi:hypothetical protein
VPGVLAVAVDDVVVVSGMFVVEPLVLCAVCH